MESPDSQKDMNTGANLEKGPFWRKQENVAKCGARLRGSPEIGSDGNDSRLPCVHNGTKPYTIAI
jgi:hypothetical protein